MLGSLSQCPDLFEFALFPAIEFQVKMNQDAVYDAPVKKSIIGHPTSDSTLSISSDFINITLYPR